MFEQSSSTFLIKTVQLFDRDAANLIKKADIERLEVA